MAKTSSSTLSSGSSTDQHQSPRSSNTISRAKRSQYLQSPSTTTTIEELLPQCKVKRNYACSKCSYYTQNPRSFLHHQKNVHAERLRVYECPHCLYASKHSQKLQRHIHMVHQPSTEKDSVNRRKKIRENDDDDKKPLLVPPVRIRVQRTMNQFSDQQHGELVIVDNVNNDETEENSEEMDEIEDQEEEDVEGSLEEEEEEENIDEEQEEDEEGDDEIDMEDEEEDDEEELEENTTEEEIAATNNQDDNADGLLQEMTENFSLTIPQMLPPQKYRKQWSELSYQRKQNKQDRQTGGAIIRCSVCPFGSHSQTLVNRHEKTAHLKKKFFRCMKCNYVTHMRARYTKHVKYHTMPMIKCADCDFRTPYKWNLDRHNRNHSSETPGTYKCSHCSFSADIKQSLTVHETNHHVPPVGGVLPAAGTNRRRYRVGASDAPGSAVDGTEIVTYETTKDGGIVEIMTETKSATSTVTTSGSTTNVSVKNGSSTVVVKRTSIPLTTVTTMTTTTSTASGVNKKISVTNTRASLEATNKTDNNNVPSRRRPMPKLIPIAGDQQKHRSTPAIMQMPRLPSPYAADMAMVPKVVDKIFSYTLTAGQSALSDFASLIDDQYDDQVDDKNAALSTSGAALTVTTFTEDDRRRSSSNAAGSSTSPKNKSSSFFDKLKAKVDETADLTCLVCRYESKCLSEFMQHQQTHSDDVDVVGDDSDQQYAAVNNKTKNAAPYPPPPLLKVTAAELKSTRCQRCRKRCKTSTELMIHLSTCEGVIPAPNNVSQLANSKESDGVNDDEQETYQQQHPMENKIFVWNTSSATAVPSMSHDDDNGEDYEFVTSKLSTIIKQEPEDNDAADNDGEYEDKYNAFYQSTATTDLVLKKTPSSIRRHGKTYKTVFKCPHCTFWAATASRFHVHIVGHLNRKPFECSCCAYRSNWRWDITKHIRLKSARRTVSEESAGIVNSHQGAKVLMTDETGRRNYSKYNRYLTVMEMDITDGADRAAGGDCEDGKGVTSRKSVGGAIRKRRTVVNITKSQNQMKLQRQQQQKQQHLTPSVEKQLSGTVDGEPTKKMKVTLVNNNQQQQQDNTTKQTSSLSTSMTVTDNRSKTVWKCKKCFFRDCDRLTVLNHVKGHYRRGEFDGSTSKNDSSSQSTNNKNNGETKNTTASKNTTEQNTSAAEHKKTKADTLLLLSTNPKSVMLYGDENFLSCPLCDVTTGSPSELKEHMQSTHIPEETKYRCEYCPFWSEEKKSMLDHMIFAHEMEDGSINIDVNYKIEQQVESNCNSNDGENENGKNLNEIRWINENGTSKDITDMEVFDNGNSDNLKTTANMEVIFDTNNENTVVETVECKPDISCDNTHDAKKKESIKLSKTSKKNCYENIATNDKINHEYNEKLNDKNIIAGVADPTPNNFIQDIIKLCKTEVIDENELHECNECWYYSPSKKDISVHKELHAKRNALYNCTECAFNVTKSSILYHHYRYGHMVEEPELKYSEESLIRAGFREIIAKITEERSNDKVTNALSDTDDSAGPPAVWSYNKLNVLPFTKVFKCRYCPHTNRRRHNTVEHEHMHSDHPDHLNHRLQQQRAIGIQSPVSPLHPCKRCTYVCNNAGVLASHAKVHSTTYGRTTLGFYDSTILDVMQVKTLEYVMELEEHLLLDSDIRDRNERYPNRFGECDVVCSRDDTKYKEIDNPELKFCPHCPARFFFRYDLKCHMQFHKYRMLNMCECCTFSARSQSHVTAHKIVHCDEYAQRTTELLTSGYPASEQYPQPLDYPTGMNNDLSKSEVEINESSQLDDSKILRTKRMRYSEPSANVDLQKSPKELLVYCNTKRRRRSSTVSDSDPDKTASVKSPPHNGSAVCAKQAVETIAINDSATTTPSITKINKPIYVKQFTCDKCPGRFFKVSALQYHMALHGGRGQHKCRRCDYTVTTYGNLIRHENLHKDLTPREKIKSLVSKTSKKLNSLPSLNAISTTMTSEKKSPVQTTHDAVGDDPPVVIKQDEESDEEVVADPEFGSSMLGNPDFYYPTTVKNGVARPKRYKCSKCPSAFDKRDQYAVHLTLHGAKDKYQCDKCDYSVRYTANFVQHQRKHARDAEIRKNKELEFDREKMIASQEEEARSSRERSRKSSVMSMQDLEKLQPPPICLNPQDTMFGNEISDRQTAYELNAAYGSTGLVGDPKIVERAIPLFRCTQCPYECNYRTDLDYHETHHQVVPSLKTTKRMWKYACQFCTYHTQREKDLIEHNRVHFIRSTGVVLSSLAAVAAFKLDPNDITDQKDHIEYHAKRVVYNQRPRRQKRNKKNDEDHDDDDDEHDIDCNDSNTTDAVPDEEEEPFILFTDRGDDYDLAEADRFCPDYTPPPVLIDFNDNRTATISAATSDKEKSIKQPACVRFMNGGKRLEFLNNGTANVDNAVVQTTGKKKRGKKK